MEVLWLITNLLGSAESGATFFFWVGRKGLTGGVGMKYNVGEREEDIGGL